MNRFLARAICWVLRKHKEKRVEASTHTLHSEQYNRICTRCGAVRLAKARKRWKAT